MINSLLLVVKKVISWPSLGLLYLNVFEEVRYVDMQLYQICGSIEISFPCIKDNLAMTY